LTHFRGKRPNQTSN